MKPVIFKQVNLTLAEDQPEYQPLPVQYNDELPEHPMTSCWELDEAEIAQIVKTGRIYIKQLVFGRKEDKTKPNPYQPILPTVFNPFAVIELAYEVTELKTVIGFVPLQDNTTDPIPAANLADLIDAICAKYLELKPENLYLYPIPSPSGIKSGIITGA